MSAPFVDGEVILQFRNGELRIMAVADSDDERKSLLQQLESAAVAGELSGLGGGNEPR